MYKVRKLFKIDQNSRTKNTIYNFVSSIGGQVLTIVLQFAVRTVFIHTLGKSYLGIGGLFSNILTMLSLAELGVGNAIIFKLYKPLAEKDYHRITLLMKFYRQVYKVIGLVVAILGLSLIPFLPYLIKDYDTLAALHINAALIFCLYLFQSVSSYLFFAYKSAIIRANQQEYLLNVTEYIFSIGLAVAQIVLLLVYPNFELYLALKIINVIIKNIIWARMADRQFPYINEKTKDSISKAEIRDIFKDCGALLLYKLDSVVLKATDNIVLSSFLGLGMVGMYSNYYIFYTTLRTLITKVFGAVAHSLGNLHAVDKSRHEYEIFRVVNLIAVILGSTAGIGVFICADEFVSAWIGHEWTIAQPFSLLMGVELITLAFRASLARYRSAMGLFQQAKYRPLLGMIINIIVSVILVRIWGICGVLVGTVAADWLTIMWYDPIIIHKYGFKAPELTKGYFLRLAKSLAVVALVGAVDYMICTHLLTDMGWLSVITHAVICGITVPAALLAAYAASYEGKYLLNAASRAAKKIVK